MKIMRTLGLVAAVGFAVGMSAGPALGQNRGKSNQPSAAQPSVPGPSKIVERVQPHEWTMTVRVNLRAQGETDLKTKMPKRDAMDFTSAAIVFPILPETASSKLKGKETDIDSRVRLNDRDAIGHADEILSDYPAGTKLGKWGLKSWQGEEVELELKIPVTAWQIKFDEAAAMKLKWPDSWPEPAQSAFEPEYFVDQGFDGPYDMAPVKDLIKQWTSGSDPKKLPPAQLAKFLMGKVLEHVQTSGNGIANARTGELEGVLLQGAPVTALSRKGNEFDVVCLLTAVYRQAGLPARTVIGLDTGDAKDKKFLGKRGSSNLRAWVEFALVDPEADPQLVWVPVDVVRLRKSSNRAPALDREWPFFGDHKELDGVVPFAFQFFPPTKGVVSHGSPAFYGWMVTPKPPEHVTQTLRFDAITTPKRGDDNMKKDDDKKDEKKKKSPYGR